MANKKKAPNVKDDKTPVSVNKPSVNVPQIISPLPLVSVVVPMYNSARYIKSCLVSVLNQTLKNLEVICVDDASTDDTVKIVSELAVKDRRIKLCKHNRNSGGPSEPRNTGIRLSRGKYIAFLDSDDMYTKSALEELVSVAEKWRADVVHTEKVYVPENNAVDVKNGIKLIPFSRESGGFCEKPFLETDKIAERVQMFHKSRFFGWVQNKLYRRDFLVGKNIFFDKLIISEDLVFYFKVLCTAPRIVRVPNIFYIYRNNPESRTRKPVSAEESFGALVDFMINGTKILDDFMNGFNFFHKNPVFRQISIDYIVQQHLAWSQKFYGKYKVTQIDPVLRQNLKKYCGEFTPFFSYIFSAANNYRKQIEKYSVAIKTLQKQKPQEPTYNLKNNMPLVSVIIPTFNSEKSVAQTLESLVYQTTQDFEVIVVDDCSTDETVKIIESFKDKFGDKLRVAKIPNHSGMPYLMRNVGIQIARGKYIAFLADNAVYEKNALEQMSTLAEKFTADVVRFKENLSEPTLEAEDIGERVRKWLQTAHNSSVETSLQFYRREFLIDNKISFPTALNDKDTSFAFAALCLAKKYLNAPNDLYSAGESEVSDKK